MEHHSCKFKREIYKRWQRSSRFLLYYNFPFSDRFTVKPPLETAGLRKACKFGIHQIHTILESFQCTRIWDLSNTRELAF